MNNPRSEIVECVKALALATTPANQRAAICKYFDPNAAFLHPMFTVPPAPGSRADIIGVYEWYRDMSPDVDLEVESFVYDEVQKVAYINVVHSFHIFMSPFKPKPARVLVKVTLKKSQEDGKYYIAQQEDYYQPEDILYLVLPFLAPPLIFAKRMAGRACSLNAAAFAMARSAVRQGMALASRNGSGREKRVDENAHLD